MDNNLLLIQHLKKYNDYFYERSCELVKKSEMSTCTWELRDIVNEMSKIHDLMLVNKKMCDSMSTTLPTVEQLNRKRIELQVKILESILECKEEDTVVDQISKILEEL
jgi:hypothetical protein